MFILATKDQSLLPRIDQARVMKNGTGPRCGIFTQYEETIEHLISGYPTLAPNEQLNRHNSVAQYLHWKICKFYEAQHLENWDEHQPEVITETDNVRILWDYIIQTDRKIKARKPDITVKVKRKKTCKLIDVKVPADKHVSVAEFENMSKYKYLKIKVKSCGI